ncbi:MAG: GreA/GreB family elongation factor [Actinomycetota bacterium]
MQPATNDRRISGPEDDRVPLTQAGRERLLARLEHLESTVLPELSALLRSPGSEAEASAAFARGIGETERLSFAVRGAVLTRNLPDDPDMVEVGELVTFSVPDGSVDSVLIVHPIEAPLDDLRVSFEAPLAAAMLGKRVGETVHYSTPTGPATATIRRAMRV